jgi:hypothetical protein
MRIYFSIITIFTLWLSRAGHFLSIDIYAICGQKRGKPGSIEECPPMAHTDLAIRHARPLGKAYRLSDCHGLYIPVNLSGSKL